MSLKLLSDENLPRAVDVLLINDGHLVIRTPSGSSDAAVAATAKKEKRIL